MITGKIAFGGGCHWCTEAVFQSLVGVKKVEQGFIASIHEETGFSEAVIVHFNFKCISLKTLVEIHLLTHASSSDHSMRRKYRSAVYTFDVDQYKTAENLLFEFRQNSEHDLITQVLPFHSFEPSREEITQYYYKDPKKPFCRRFIDPKLQLLLKRFSSEVNHKKVAHLKQMNTHHAN